MKLKTAWMQNDQFYYIKCYFLANFVIFTIEIYLFCVQRDFILKTRYFFQAFLYTK